MDEISLDLREGVVQIAGISTHKCQEQMEIRCNCHDFTEKRKLSGGWFHSMTKTEVQAFELVKQYPLVELASDM